ncbi:MAG: inositol-3-phosphate synthase, partial [Candidatus Thorarchaeota archaeon]
MSGIKVAIIGIGNSASALVQGVEHYKDAKANEENIGLNHSDFAGYHVSDIKFVAAFDVADTKVGFDLGEAIFAKPNNVMKFADIQKIGVKVHKGQLHDGVDDILKALVTVSKESETDVVKILKESGAEI